MTLPKKLPTLLCLLLLSLHGKAHATKIYTARSSSISHTELVALVQSERGINPVFYTWTSLNFIGFPMVIPFIKQIESSIPSILIGEGIQELSQQSHVLYIGGRDIQPLDLNHNDGWFETQFLGWVNAKQYPNMYSPLHGWIYCYEDPEGTISLYFYNTRIWKTANDSYYYPGGSPFDPSPFLFD